MVTVKRPKDLKDLLEKVRAKDKEAMAELLGSVKDLIPPTPDFRAIRGPGWAEKASKVVPRPSGPTAPQIAMPPPAAPPTPPVGPTPARELFMPPPSPGSPPHMSPLPVGARVRVLGLHPGTVTQSPAAEGGMHTVQLDEGYSLVVPQRDLAPLLQAGQG